MSDFKNKQTQIAKIEEETAEKIKVRDVDNVLYTIWKKKKDDSITVAYELWGKIPDQFMQVNLSYTEKPYSFVSEGKEITGTHKNITGLKWSASQQPQVMQQKIANDTIMREEVKQVHQDDVQQHIKWGLAWNVASRLSPVSGKESVSVVEEIAKEIYKRVQELPKEESPLSNMPSASDEINIEDVPY